MRASAKSVRIESGIALFFALIIITFTLIFGVSITTNYVIGANITNDTVITRVYVWNTEPNLYDVTITPSIIELTSEATTQVNCTGKFWDYNGWQDVGINGTVNATLYHSTSSHIAADDYNVHYTNNSCAGNSSCSAITGSNGQNGTCTCRFTVQYFTNSGTWTCNMSIKDSGINITDPSRITKFNDSMTGAATVAKLLAISMPPEIDFGNLSVTETSSEITENITNVGNIQLNVTAYTYGGSNESAPGANTTAMFCSLGNISTQYMRYTVSSGTNFAEMFNITNNITSIWVGNSSLNYSMLSIPSRTNDNNKVLGQDINQTFWKLNIPLSVGGLCNGTIVFFANDAS